MGTDLRLTPQTLAVVRALLVDPATARYGLDLARETGLKTGTLHPILTRLESAGWVESFWEKPSEHEDQGRPRRRYYRFTGDGAQSARRAVNKVATCGTAGLPALRAQPGF